MGITDRPNNLDGAYAPVSNVPGDQMSPIHATTRPNPHPAFVTDHDDPSLFFDTLGNLLFRRADAVRMIYHLSAVILGIGFLTLGLSANAASQVGSTNTPSATDPMGVIVVTIAGFAEVTLFLSMSFCFLYWNWHGAYFLSIAVMGVTALGSGAYGMAIIGISMSNNVCTESKSEGCVEALKKGMAASCIRVLLT